MAHFEIEIKSLLGKQEHADALREKLQTLLEPARLVRKSSQLNHYFLVGDWENTSIICAELFKRGRITRFGHGSQTGRCFSWWKRRLMI